MGGALTPEHTPGGGLTMVLSLPATRAGTAGPTVPGDRDEQSSRPAPEPAADGAVP
jgi:hypothetical protein